jgi:predicted porin
LAELQQPFRVKAGSANPAALESIEEETFSMNKKLMALAVAAAVTAPGLALAQVPTTLTAQPGVASNAGITLYGRVDETLMINQYKDAANLNTGTGPATGTLAKDVTKSDIYSPGNAMGVKGREDLGGGTAAWFQLEIGVWPSERLDTSTITGNNWGGRNSAIGISSGVGDILLGNWDTPYKQTYFLWNSLTSGGFSAGGITMGMADSTGALNNVACTGAVSPASGSVTTGVNGVCVTEATVSPTAWSRRVNNSVQYWSPVMGGFQVKLMTAMANYQSPANVYPNGVPKPKEYSANATWARGPLSAGIGYDFHQGLRPNTAVGGVIDPKDTAIQVGAKWNFGPGEIGVGYEEVSYGNNAISTAKSTKMKVPAYVVNGRFNIGPGALWASYSGTDAKDCDITAFTAAVVPTGQTVGGIGSAVCGVKAKMYTLGYDYVLSKRTKLYVAYHKIDNGVAAFSPTTNVGSAYYYIAGPAANGNLGTGGALAGGTDVTTFGLGVQHVF